MVSDVRGPERKACLKAAPPMLNPRTPGGVSIAAQSIVTAEPAPMARELVGHGPDMFQTMKERSQKPKSR